MVTYHSNVVRMLKFKCQDFKSKVCNYDFRANDIHDATY